MPLLRSQRGVTLIELAVGLAIVGILVMVALPNFSVWIQNGQIRTAAEAINNGLQLARSEAVRRNLNIEFVLGAGAGWTVQIAATNEAIQTRATGEGGTSSTVTVSPGGATTVTFNGLGRAVANGDGSNTISEIKVDSTSIPAADSREMCIMVSGGAVKLCDPQVAAGDPRACVPAAPAGCL